MNGYELTFDGKPAVDWFLQERGSYLMPEERQWLKAQQRSWLSVWEVRSVEPGIRVDVKDFLTGETRTVTEVSGSQTLHPHLAILARVVDMDGLNLFCGTQKRTGLKVATGLKGGRLSGNHNLNAWAGLRVKTALRPVGSPPTTIRKRWPG